MEPLADARAYLERCKRRKEQGDLAGAIADLDEALKLHPDLPAAYSLRGGIRILQRDAAGALADCDRALGADPRLLEAYQTRALAYQLQGDIDKALADCGRAIEIDPANAVSYMVRSGIRTSQGDISSAMEDFQKAIRLDPSVGTPLQGKAAGTERTPGGADDPQDAAAFLRRAEQRRAEGNLADAVLDCGQALKLDPRSVDALLARGLCRQEQGYADRAIADFNRALEVEPGNSRAYMLRGRVRGSQGSLDEARADYDRAIETDPANSQAYTYRAQIRAAHSDTEGAIADCNRALEIDPRNAEAYLARAAARWEQGDLDRALNDCDEAILLEPDEARAYLLRGNVRQAKGDGQGAGEDFRLAVKLDSSLAGAIEQEEEGEAGSAMVPLGTGQVTADHEPLQAEEHGPTLPGGAGGPRSWIVAGTIHGALAGVVYGLISREAVGIALALIFFTPFLLNLFLGSQIGARSSIIVGLSLAIMVIAGSIAGLVAIEPPFIGATGDLFTQAPNIVCWLLAWGVFGAFVAVFVGTSRIGRIVASSQGGMPRAMKVARRGLLGGLLLGAILALVYRLLPGGYAGSVAALCAGLIVGGVAGNDRWAILFGLGGAVLGGYFGNRDDEAVYRVLGAGVAGGVYWSLAGGLVGVFVGASVGSRAAPRVAKGPLFGRLLGQTPNLQGRGANFATGLVGAVGGLFVGGSIGSVAGCLLGGLTEVPSELPVPASSWPAAGGILGAVFAILFSGRAAYYGGPRPEERAREPMTVPLELHRQVWLGVAGILIGAVLGSVAWLATPNEVGNVIYWVLAGAGSGGIIGAKLWTVVEK
jgi:tetratricopeptide (TPR) repeat protein